MIKIQLSIFLFSFASAVHLSFSVTTGCYRIDPKSVISDGNSRLHSFKDLACGKKIQLHFVSPIQHVSLDMTDTDKNRTETVSFLVPDSGVTEKKTNESLYSVHVTISDHKTIITVYNNRPSMCIKNLHAISCTPNHESIRITTDNSHNTNSTLMRLKRFDSNDVRRPLNIAVYIILTIIMGILSLVAIGAVVAIVSIKCCDVKFFKHSKSKDVSLPEEGIPEGIKDFSNSVSSRAELIPPAVDQFQLSTTSTSPIEKIGTYSPQPYLRPTSLSISSVHSATGQVAIANGHGDGENNRKSVAVGTNGTIIPDHRYSNVIKHNQQTGQGFTPSDRLCTQHAPTGNHGYFVLDVTLDNPSDSTPMHGSDDGPTTTTPTVNITKTDTANQHKSLSLSQSNSLTGANRIYHVLEPLQSEVQHCTVCNRLVEDEPDSVCLVLLADVTTPNISEDRMPSVDSTTDKSEPLYQVLEKSPVVCQNCLYATINDPIYNEVEKLPEPIYEQIKMFRRDFSFGESSHLYMSLEVPDANTPSVAPRKKYLREIRMISSSDYASIPSTPSQGTPVRHVSIDEHPELGHMSHFVNALKERFTQQNGATVNPVITDKQPRKERNNSLNDYAEPIRCGSSTMSTSTRLMKTFSHEYTPLIPENLQKRRTSNDQSFNLDIDGYMPLLIRNGKRGTSLKSRKSIFKEWSKQSSSSSREYEEPISIRPLVHVKPKARTPTEPPSHALPLKERTHSQVHAVIHDKFTSQTLPHRKIPPPLLLKSNTNPLFRQNAIPDYDEKPIVHNQSLKPMSLKKAIRSSSFSDPCLSHSISNDYDQLAPLEVPATENKLKPLSPTNKMFLRTRTAPALRPVLLYGKKDSEDYDSLSNAN